MLMKNRMDLERKIKIVIAKKIMMGDSSVEHLLLM